MLSEYQECPMVAHRLFATVLAAILLVACASAASAANLPNSFSSATPVASPEAAVQEAVQAAGAVYSGDCSNASPANYGQVCSKFVDEQGGIRAYMTGRPFAEFDTWLFVEQTPDGWIPLSSASVDQTATSVSIPWPAG
jgi:hypothetical protein